MPKKQNKKRGIFWWIVGIITTIIIAIIIAPTFINLNSLRKPMENAIFKQTGLQVQIDGDINFGLVGQPTIVAHNVRTPNGTVKTLAIKVPFIGLFDIKETKLDGAISVSGARINLKSLATLNLDYDLDVRDSVLVFMGKEYRIIDGTFQNGTFNGLVRTGQHKYDIRFNEKNFTVKNKNMNLEINGELYPSGAAGGTMDIATNKINEWFEFDEPQITSHVNLSTDFWWDGGYGFRFYNLVANNVRGNIELEPNGWHTINLYSDDTRFDFSFLTHQTKILRDTRLNIDFIGDLTFEDRTFDHVKIDTLAFDDYIQINSIIADKTSFTGGTMDVQGGHDIMIKTEYEGTNLECLFSGTRKDWDCARFVYGDITGKIQYHKKNLIAEINANRTATIAELESYLARLGIRNANIKFRFANIGGLYIMKNGRTEIKYDYVYGKSLSWWNPHIKLLPEFMKIAPGNMVWTDNTMTFVPNDNKWSLTLHNNFFYLTGDSIKKWFPNTDLRAVRDFDYTASGFYNDRGDLSDLTIKIAGHVFTGSATKDGITLHTNILELDAFLNPEFFNHYDEMEFVANAPIMIPFDFDKNIYLGADSLVIGDNAYRNFVYALKSGTQTFSIADTARGNMLATIIRERSEYDIFVQQNNFVINGELLGSHFPLNITNSTITAEISLHTSGHIAHDIWYNMVGDIDLSFDGGYINGIGIDAFYANSENLNRTNLQDFLITALESGETKIKNMRIIGKYESGNFTTTKPLTISMRHADAVGALSIEHGGMTAKLDISMRAVAPDPVIVSVAIAPNGKRGYSISEIMRYFDPAFMRSFIKTHNKF